MKKHTLESFVEKANKVHNHKYDYGLVEYKNSRTKIVILCPIHGKFEQEANCHIQGQGCKKCGDIQKGLTYSKAPKGESVADKYPELCKDWSDKNEFGPEHYRYGSKKKVLWKCHKCNHEWEQIPCNRTVGQNGCPQCSGRILSDFNRLSVRYPDISAEWDYDKNHPLRPEDISFGIRKKIWWICPNCNNSYISLVNSRTCRNTACSKCNASNGERQIEKFLKEYNIKYEREYRIKECKNKQPLPFDFAIWINDELRLIEFNGEQHYKTDNRRFNSEEQLKKIQYRDNIKQNYCKDNNIPLLVIPYKKLKQIQEILHVYIQETQNFGGVRV